LRAQMQNMNYAKLSPELKNIMKSLNISQDDMQRKLNERSMHIMHVYIKLIHLRLKDNMIEPHTMNSTTNQRITDLLQVLDQHV